MRDLYYYTIGEIFWRLDRTRIDEIIVLCVAAIVAVCAVNHACAVAFYALCTSLIGLTDWIWILPIVHAVRMAHKRSR